MDYDMFDYDSACATAQRSFPRFNPDKLAEVWAVSIVNDAGYATREDLVRSHREEVKRLFPTASELRARGVDVVNLAACFRENLIVRESFNDMVKSLPVNELNHALDHLLEGSEAFRAHPDDALDRAMHIQGCCSCRAA